MCRSIILVFVLMLAGTCLAAPAGTDSELQQKYSHVQDLNNAGAEVVYAKSPSKEALRKALTELKESQAVVAGMGSRIDEATQLGGHLQDRRRDNLRFQADAYARLGDKQAALNALEAWAADDLYAEEEKWLREDKYLENLHDDPRYKALIARIDAIADRWNANAFTRSDAGLSEEQRVAGLSLFWSEARYNFVYFDHVPTLDWNQAYLDFLPKVIAAKNLHDYYDVMMQLAPLLRDGHTNIYPPESIRNQFYAAPPISTALVQNHVLVTYVDSPRVAALGVHTGDEIVSVDGQEVHRYALRHVEPYVSSSTPQDRDLRVYGYQLLSGDQRKSVALELKDASGKVRTVELSREEDPEAKPAPRFVFRMLPGGVAYLSLDEFEDDQGEKAFEQHLLQIQEAKGLILDLRRNGGGSSEYAGDILSWLTDKPIPVERSRTLEYVPAYRAWNGPSAVWKDLGEPGETFTKPRARHFTGPVAVLIGPRTFSAAEDFVVSFDAMKRGILVGQRTAGSTGQPLFFKLPGGGSARICVKRDTYPDGREFVGTGIAPQIEAAPTVADIRAGRDPVIETAAAALLQNRTPRSAAP